ncbi:MAG: helicase-related protein [Alphaproteobacteria bacterium]|nr:helicase-related protein [Alphaproteobacteria bacterium]
MYKKLIALALSTSILFSSSLFAGYDDEYELSLKASNDFLQIPAEYYENESSTFSLDAASVLLEAQQHDANFAQFMLDYEQQESPSSQSLDELLSSGQIKEVEIQSNYPQNNISTFFFNTPAPFLAVPQYNFHNVTFGFQATTSDEDLLHKILFTDQMVLENIQPYSFSTTLSNPVLQNFLKPSLAIQKTKKEKKLDINLEAHLKDVLLDRSSLQGKLIQTQEQEYNDFCSKFSFSLTSCQENAISQINQEFISGKPMNRVLVGSVGFGKTEVAIRTAYKVAKSGHQVVILAPLRTLAEQHYKTFSERFEGTGINVAYIPSGYKQKGMLNDISLGKAQIIIGTHAVFSDAIKYKDIGYIIIDEEHKLGVKQKEKLRQHFTNAHVLWMSATLIPRTLELVNKGLMSSSHLTTPPVGRLAIVSNFMNFVEDEIRPILDFELNRQGQVYIIVPKVCNIQGTLDLIQQLYADRKVAMVHGEMSKNDISSNLEDFKTQQIDILIATTVIEVGIDVPNANTMIICDPKCFGMAQLSQLRGRVGRSPVQAYCYVGLNPDDEIDNPSTLARLNAFVENSNLGDDMKLAELDLKFRGAGDLTSDRQKGQGGGWRN